MTLYEFNEAGLGFEHDCEVKDDDGYEQIIKYWIEPSEVEDGKVKKYHVCTDWAVEFGFNALDNDTPSSVLEMAESCIKDAYYDEDF